MAAEWWTSWSLRSCPIFLVLFQLNFVDFLPVQYTGIQTEAVLNSAKCRLVKEHYRNPGGSGWSASTGILNLHSFLWLLRKVLGLLNHFIFMVNTLCVFPLLRSAEHVVILARFLYFSALADAVTSIVTETGRLSLPWVAGKILVF